MGEGGIRGRPERNKEGKAREVKVSAGSSGENRSIGEGEGHGWKSNNVMKCYKMLQNVMKCLKLQK